MRRVGLPRLTAPLDSLNIRMDHRVKPGGDDRETSSLARHCERQRSNPVGLRENLDCFVAVAPRNDEWSKKHDKVPPMRGENQ
jgi:hypothetical protein